MFKTQKYMNCINIFLDEENIFFNAATLKVAIEIFFYSPKKS